MARAEPESQENCGPVAPDVSSGGNLPQGIAPGSHRLPRVGSAVLVVDGDRLLLGTRAKEPNRGKWVLPGGGVRPFETIGAAAKRELLEETGLEVEIERPVDILEIIDPPNEHRVIVYSVARKVGGQLQPASDLERVQFWDRAELKKLEVSDAIVPVLERLGWA